jgi:hypothetical protein
MFGALTRFQRNQSELRRALMTSSVIFARFDSHRGFWATIYPTCPSAEKVTPEEAHRCAPIGRLSITDNNMLPPASTASSLVVAAGGTTTSSTMCTTVLQIPRAPGRPGWPQSSDVGAARSN